MGAPAGGVLSNKKFYYQFVAKIPLSTEPLLVTVPSKDLESGNTAVEVYFQVGKDNIADRVVIDMLVHLMVEPLYSQLRTKEQYGYRVSCDSRWTVGVMGMKFVVVTAVKSAVSAWKSSPQRFWLKLTPAPHYSHNTFRLTPPPESTSS
jgi:nardilysin